MSKESAILTAKQMMRQIYQEQRYRKFLANSSHPTQFPTTTYHPSAQKKKNITLWCSNDYLALGRHPKIIKKMQQALAEFGCSAGGTRNISGTHMIHEELEKKLADFHEKERALLFNSGYMANFAGLSAIIKILQPIIYSDQENHNSIVNAIRFARAVMPELRKRIFRHNDLSHLQEQLENDRHQEGARLIICESVYSMSGSFVPLAKLIKIAKKYDAFIYLDEVHAIGIYGKTGAGRAQELGVQKKIDFLQGTLGKSFGQLGGYLAADQLMIDLIRLTADGFIFTTSLPPHICSGALSALQLIKEGANTREYVRKQSERLRLALRRLKIPVLESSSHILSVMVCNSEDCNRLSSRLLEKHACYLTPINFPTVSRGSERLRISLGPKHTPAMIHQLISALEESWDFLQLKR